MLAEIAPFKIILTLGSYFATTGLLVALATHYMTQDFEASLKKLEAGLGEAQTVEQQKIAFHRILDAYPLLYGYWMRLVALEPSAWDEALAACPCVELWHQYVQSTPTEENFEKAIGAVGRYFQSHPIWDLYLAKTNDKNKVLSAVTKIPLYNYGRYAAAALESGIETDKAEMARAVSERWAFESRIARPYFHVVPIDEYELRVWDAYLDYEEAQGDIQQIEALYVRCLMATALYPGFWLRYIRWVSAFDPLKALAAAKKARHYHSEHSDLRLWNAFLLEQDGSVEEALGVLSEDPQLRDVYEAMCDRAQVEPVAVEFPEKKPENGHSGGLTLDDIRARGDLDRFFALDISQNGPKPVDFVEKILE